LNQALFQAARQAGCTAREAEVLATYVESQTIMDTAIKLQTSERAVAASLARARKRVKAPHVAALVVAILSARRAGIDRFIAAG
jgi:DNA-binding CsgD family transcriptional regulator